MKIMHIETGRHLYGGARQVEYLVDALAGRDFEQSLICLPQSPLANIGAAEIIAMPMRGDFDFSFRRQLIALMRDRSPDIVHVHSRRGADSFGGQAARIAGVPALLTRRVESNEPKFWTRLKCKPFGRIVAISSAVRDELQKAGVGAERVSIVPSAVDPTLFGPSAAARLRLIERFDLPRDAVIIGSAAQFVARKGLKLLPELIASLIRDVPQARLLMFGQGPERGQIHQQVVRLGLEQHIALPGFVADWPTLVGGLDLFLHPARREGLGVVILEAMSAGVPVIAARSGGIVDAIDSDIDGTLLTPDALAEWRAATLDLLRDPVRREQMALNARRKVERQFTIERMAERYIELYDEILQHRAG